MKAKEKVLKSKDVAWVKRAISLVEMKDWMGLLDGCLMRSLNGFRMQSVEPRWLPIGQGAKTSTTVLEFVLFLHQNLIITTFRQRRISFAQTILTNALSYTSRERDYPLLRTLNRSALPSM